MRLMPFTRRTVAALAALFAPIWSAESVTTQRDLLAVSLSAGDYIGHAYVAPTIASHLGVVPPSGSTGSVLAETFHERPAAVGAAGR